jgi:hypothetical protein
MAENQILNLNTKKKKKRKSTKTRKKYYFFWKYTFMIIFSNILFDICLCHVRVFNAVKLGLPVEFDMKNGD